MTYTVTDLTDASCVILLAALRAGRANVGSKQCVLFTNEGEYRVAVGIIDSINGSSDDGTLKIGRYPDRHTDHKLWITFREGVAVSREHFMRLDEILRRLDDRVNGKIEVPSSLAQPSAEDRQVGGNHYKAMDIQPWSAMKAWLTKEEYIGFLRGNIIKYHARANSGKEDKKIQLLKAGHYQQELEAFLESIKGD